MNPLILDFLRRWRWLFAIALLISLGTAIAGMPFLLAPAAILGLLFDGQRGVFSAVRALPVARIDQARAWWFVGVPLLPLLSLPLLAIGVLLFQQFNATGNPPVPQLHAPAPLAAPLPAEVQAERDRAGFPDPIQAQENGQRFITRVKPLTQTTAPWFAACVQAWVALGYAGFCFFLMQWAPTRPAENVSENVQQGVFGALWGISMPGALILFPILPRSPSAVAPWHWAIFMAVPIFVALSYFSAAELLRRRMFVTTAKSSLHPAVPAQSVSTGLTGVPLYIVNFGGRIALFVALIAAAQILVFHWMMQGNARVSNPGLEMRVGLMGLMGLMIGAATAESIGMRALRALPLSTVKLALLLSLIPWAGAIPTAVFSAVWCGSGDPTLSVWMNLAAQSVALCGWATLAFAATMHIAGSSRLFVLMLIGMIPGVGLPFAAKYTLVFTASGSVAGIGGFALLVRGLRKSSAFYRPRGFFGITPGQPSAVR